MIRGFSGRMGYHELLQRSGFLAARHRFETRHRERLHGARPPAYLIARPRSGDGTPLRRGFFVRPG